MNHEQIIDHGLNGQTKLLDPYKREDAPTPGSVGFIRGDVRAVDEQERTVEFVISSNEVDRYTEIVDQKAFDKKTIEGFMANPVLLAGHQHIGWNGEPTIIGHWLSIKREGDVTVGVAKIANTQLANDYWQLIRDKALRACSIGFIVREWVMREIGENKLKVRVFTKIELIEISLVAVPANRAALMKAAGFGGLLAPTADDTGEGSGAIKQLITEALKAHDEQLIEQLSDPDGPVARMIEEVIERAADREGMGSYFDPGERSAGDESGEDPGGTSGGDSGGGLDELLG